MKQVKMEVLLLIAFLVFPTISHADLIAINLTAVIDRVEIDERSGDPFEGGIQVNDIITGSYFYDSMTPDSRPSYSVGAYWHYSSTYGISLNVGGFNFQTDPDNVKFLMEICNDHPWFNPSVNIDNYLLRSDNNLPLSNGIKVDQISWQLDDDTGSALTNISIPTVPPVLNHWQQPVGLIIEGTICDTYEFPGPENFHIFSHVTSVSEVPEPMTILILGVGGAILLRRRRRVWSCGDL